jgi:3-oxoacyl-(acyl-carrier-protein) synthase
MKIYIRSTGNISPQDTFGQSIPPAEVLPHPGNRMRCVEPAYTDLIDVKLIRRMSRIIRMGVAAAMQCLKEGSSKTPDAIITGTAYGCLEDTGIFLTKLVENREELLTPTAFIQSTHNTVGAQIALLLKCHNYNNTFVQRGFSFESALHDACLLLAEKNMDQILVGAVDEITDTSHAILSRFGLYKNNLSSNLDLFSNSSKGTINGEGAGFFLLDANPGAGNLALLEGLETFYKINDPSSLSVHIESFLARQDAGLRDIDLVITGKNGDPGNDQVYGDLEGGIFKDLRVMPYKQLCGEYPTSSAFALWLATILIHSQVLPGWIPAARNQDETPIRRILIYNHYQHLYHSLYLVSAC